MKYIVFTLLFVLFVNPLSATKIKLFGNQQYNVDSKKWVFVESDQIMKDKKLKIITHKKINNVTGTFGYKVHGVFESSKKVNEKNIIKEQCDLYKKQKKLFSKIEMKGDKCFISRTSKKELTEQVLFLTKTQYKKKTMYIVNFLNINFNKKEKSKVEKDIQDLFKRF